MKPRWPAPDFVRQPRPVPWLGWLVLLAGTAVLAVALGEVLDLRSAVDTDRSDVDRLERRWRAASRVGLAMGTDASAAAAPAAERAPVSLDAARALRRTEQQLAQPWERAFTGLEQATAPGVQWLALEIEGADTRLRAEGIAPSVEGALAVVDALAVRAGWADVVLNRLQAADANGAAAGVVAGVVAGVAVGQRFEISARWAQPSGPSASAPSLAPSPVPGTGKRVREASP